MVDTHNRRAASPAKICWAAASLTGLVADFQIWCGRENSNFHGSYPTATSTLRVYQFRHDRTIVGGGLLAKALQRLKVFFARPRATVTTPPRRAHIGAMVEWITSPTG